MKTNKPEIESKLIKECKAESIKAALSMHEILKKKYPQATK
ncbi:hypothetical protein [Acinetobacter halotolerans]|nr:hypothetical protein [Acinetobacter halotolerans]